MYQLLQLAGAVLVLLPFAGIQLGSLRTDSTVYLVPNFVGSGLLAMLALAHQQWGFLLLEGCWAVVVAWSLRARPRA
jgi:hypothetical protein